MILFYKDNKTKTICYLENAFKSSMKTPSIQNKNSTTNTHGTQLKMFSIKQPWLAQEYSIYK